MKKILISILIVLLLILTYIVLDKGINIGSFRINSIKDIKDGSIKLDEDLAKANELLNKTYPTEVEGLEEAIKNLKISKQNYENKKLYNTESEALNVVEIKTYTIHYLWTILGNYKKDTGLKSLTLDLKSTNNEDVYDLEFTLVGSYIGITDFLYEIEDDEELKFEIKDFSISSAGTSQNSTTNANKLENANTTNNTTTTGTTSTTNKQNTASTDGTTLQATFVVENVGITLE